MIRTIRAAIARRREIQWQAEALADTHGWYAWQVARSHAYSEPDETRAARWWAVAVRLARERGVDLSQDRMAAYLAGR